MFLLIRKYKFIVGIILVFLLPSCFNRVDLYQLATTSPSGGQVGELSLIDAESTSHTTVRVYFSGEVEPLSAETESNYLIPGLKISSALRDPKDFSVVNLVTYP
jgi:hypothetical protein